MIVEANQSSTDYQLFLIPTVKQIYLPEKDKLPMILYRLKLSVDLLTTNFCPVMFCASVSVRPSV